MDRAGLVKKLGGLAGGFDFGNWQEGTIEIAYILDKLRQLEVVQNPALPKVASICVHNSCRSQIMEALLRVIAPDVCAGYSAGTGLYDVNDRKRINPDAIRIMRDYFGIDMSGQENRLYTHEVREIPDPDFIYTMGCNVPKGAVPMGSCKSFKDLGYDDPTGKEDVEFVKVIVGIVLDVIEIREGLGNG
jgi:arsenate reductase